jgi:hypothetical protein
VTVSAGPHQGLCDTLHCRRCPAHRTLDFIVARPGEVPPGCRRLLSAADTRRRLGSCTPGSIRRTAEAAGLLPHGWGYPELVAALDSRRLVALDTAIRPTVRLPVGTGASRTEAPPEPPPFEEAEKILTWIGIELLGEDCRPLGGEPYRVESPAGDVYEGRLDEKGRARLDGLDPGRCRITFPGLDERAWTSDVRCPETPAARPLPFIGIELVDMAGGPVPNEPFVVVLPDGIRYEGRLDGSGRARLVGVAEGDCKISFPMLDEECWEAVEA